MEETLNRLEQDFAEGNGPFSDVQFPEERLLEEVASETMEQKMRTISIFCMFDYNRDANQLVDNLIELWDSGDRLLFKPHRVVGLKPQRIEERFEEIGFRYPSRDANGLVENSKILMREYHGSWNELLLSVGTDAPSLVDRLEEDGFLYMKGLKIAPMYARIVNDNVVPLSNLWELDIPVDTHIRRLSKDLFKAPDASDGAIRAEWRRIGEEYDINRAVIDGGLWHIGNKWDEWGEDYWNEVVSNG